MVSVEAQAIGYENIRSERLQQAFEGISIDQSLYDMLGPAVNSNAGMFLYGAPGNGKSTLARRLTMCFGQKIWIPRVVVDDGQLIKLFDAAYHSPVTQNNKSMVDERDFDRRWIQITRPTVVVGGELTMDSLEIRHSSRSNICEAPLQMKSNGGCLLIDDFGRQRIAPGELLNRWIIPLENRYDFLTLPTGKKIQIPFEQLIIFSTNLSPCDLVDEAFLRRIPYKIEVQDPSPEEFHRLFAIACDASGCEYRADVVDWLIEQHYRQTGRAMRRCHPRDLLKQVRNYCAYRDLEFEMTPEFFDLVVPSYFTDTPHRDSTPHAAAPAMAGQP